ncbi:MAG: YbjN domain-containing protein [Propionibacteriaceae bacterium]|jgi:hypothetical protein|nr:YbjN domain-containing protein [Propionibacteriaceae bacterium]
MGYFTRPDGSALSELAPLTTDRVRACMDSHHWHYDISEEGDVGGWWDGYWFVFSFRGRDNEILFAHALWSRKVPADRFAEALAFANEWNLDHLWPMLSVKVRGEHVVVMADVSVDYSFGLTDSQLDLHVRCAIDTIVAALSWLDSKFPEYVEADSAA